MRNFLEWFNILLIIPLNIKALPLNVESLQRSPIGHMAKQQNMHVISKSCKLMRSFLKFEYICYCLTRFISLLFVMIIWRTFSLLVLLCVSNHKIMQLFMLVKLIYMIILLKNCCRLTEIAQKQYYKLNYFNGDEFQIVYFYNTCGPK
jgi:hypothetical protein